MKSVLVRLGIRDFRPQLRKAPPLFRGVTGAGAPMGAAMSDKIVARLMKQAGVDPERFSEPSPRRGLLATAGDLQLPLIDLMHQSRHVSSRRSAQTHSPKFGVAIDELVL
jgi:hypothetical protein